MDNEEEFFSLPFIAGQKYTGNVNEPSQEILFLSLLLLFPAQCIIIPRKSLLPDPPHAEAVWNSSVQLVGLKKEFIFRLGHVSPGQEVGKELLGAVPTGDPGVAQGEPLLFFSCHFQPKPWSSHTALGVFAPLKPPVPVPAGSSPPPRL